MAKRHKRKPVFKARRASRDAQSRSVNHYSARIGEIIWAWNDLHEMLQFFFWPLATPQSILLGNAIWRSLRSDSAQRAVLKAILPHASPMRTDLIDGISWLLDALTKLTPYRNDLVHVPTQPNWTELTYVRPSFTAAFLNPAISKRMKSGVELRRFLGDLRGDLYALTEYADALRHEMQQPGYYEKFPQPPVLRSLPPEKSATGSGRSARNSRRKAPAKGR